MTEKRAAKGSGKQAAKRGRWLLLALGLWLVIGASVHASIPPLELKPSSLDRFEELLSHTPLPQASSRAWVPLASAPRYRLFEPPPPGGGFLGLRRSAEEDRAWAKSRVWAFDLGWEEQHQWAQWLRVKIAEGVFVERYEYSPFGERSILVDSTPPEVHQVRVVAGELWLEMSEEIRWEAFVAGVADGRVTLENVTTSASYPLEADQLVVSGRARGRRIVLRQQGTDPWPAAGDEVRFQVAGQGLIVEGDPPRPGSPLEDLFRNQPFEDLVTTLTWPSADGVISDTKAPFLEELCVVEGGFLEAQFSEPVDPALLGGEFLVDGGSVTWIAEVSGYLLRSDTGVAVGPHTFSIGTGALDLSGKGLTDPFSGGVEVTGTEEHFVFEAAPPGLVLGTKTGNRLGFQGLEEETDTGLLYVRNRWYDPQLARFITTDPLGYVDSPSLYAGFGWRPNVATDPLGLEAGGFNLNESPEIQAARQKVREDYLRVQWTYLFNHLNVQGLSQYPETWRDEAADFYVSQGLSPGKAARRIVELLGPSECTSSPICNMEGVADYLPFFELPVYASLFFMGPEAMAGVETSGVHSYAALLQATQLEVRAAQRAKVLANIANSADARSGSKFHFHLETGTGPAHSAASAERLRIRLAAEEIAQGHAFEKHVLQQGEFIGLGVRTRTQFRQHVESVMSNPTGMRYYRDERVAYLHEPSGTVIIRNPISGESTAFQPANWIDYVTTRLPARTTPYP